MFQIQIRTLLSVFTIAALGHDYYSVDAAPLDPSGYSLYSSNGDVTLNNLTQVSIGGNVRSEISTCTFNNISSLSIIGSVVCSGNIKFNNLSGSVTGVIHSLSGVTVSKGFSTGGTTVVNSISPLLLGQTSAPVGSLDPNYVLPITIVTGDYDVNGSVTLSGTIFATGDIHINNGSSISGSGALVAAGAVHLNNVSSVGTSGAQFFIYALGSGGIDTNNISSLAIKGTLYAPNGAVKLNNIGTVNISGGIFGNTLNLNNITSLTVGASSFASTVMPPGITNPVTPPAAPSNLVAAAASFTSVALTWIDNSSNETNFLIERSSDGIAFTQIASTNANVTSYIDAGLPTNSTYYYRVRASNGAGNSAYTNTSNAVLLSPPNAPSNLTVNGSTNNVEIDLAWLDNSSNEASFRIERSIDGTTFTEIGSVSANITNDTDNGLQAATYTYRVRAQNAAGYSAYSNIATATLTGPGNAGNPSNPNQCDPMAADSAYNDPNNFVATAQLCGILIK